MRYLLILLTLVGVATVGCRMVDETVRLPGMAIGAIGVGGRAKSDLDPAEVQARVLRYADELIARTGEGITAWERQAGLPTGAGPGLAYRLSAMSASVSAASGANPVVSLLDLATMTTLTRVGLEERVRLPGGEAFGPWLALQRSLETNVWSQAHTLLGPDRPEELRSAILQWREANPELDGSFFARPLATPESLAGKGGASDRPGSVFGLIGLDPMSGLDPAVREVTRSRLLAERAMFVAQHLPLLLRLQTELLADQLANRPDVVNAMTNVAEVSVGVGRLGRAAESLSVTAAGLPDRVAAERAAILTALENQQGRLRELAAELTTTLGAGDRMSTSLNATLVTFDALMKRFGVGEPEDGPPLDTNASPFRVLDYAETADRLALAAREWNALVKDLANTLDSPALERRTRDLEAAVDRVQAGTRGLLNHAALLAAGLVVLTFLCALAWRRAGRTLKAR